MSVDSKSRSLISVLRYQKIYLGDGYASMYPEKLSTKHIGYLFPESVFGYGPHISMETTEKGNGGIDVSDDMRALIAFKFLL